MTRLEAVDKLCDSYSAYFDVERFDEEDTELAATCFLYVHSEKYVLVKAAKLWEADSNEYVYIFSVPHLTKDIFTKCRDYAYNEGMSHIEPKAGHMCSYITALFICDTADADAVKALKRTRIYKSFRLSYYGWMDFHTGVIELSTNKTSANASGRCTAQLLDKVLLGKGTKRKKLFNNSLLFK